jgi:hypothetical protein
VAGRETGPNQMGDPGSTRDSHDVADVRANTHHSLLGIPAMATEGPEAATSSEYSFPPDSRFFGKDHKPKSPLIPPIDSREAAIKSSRGIPISSHKRM